MVTLEMGQVTMPLLCAAISSKAYRIVSVPMRHQENSLGILTCRE